MEKPQKASAKPGDDWGEFEKPAEKAAARKPAGVDWTRPPFLVAYTLVGLLIMVFLFRSFFGGRSGPALTQVTGTVTMGGKPLAGAVVTFHPAAKKGDAAFGRTDRLGHFEMRSAAGRGVLPDEYRVTITKFASEEKIMNPDEAKKYTSKEGKAPPAPKVDNLVPPQYASIQGTPLNAPVKGRRPVRFSFDLK